MFLKIIILLYVCTYPYRIYCMHKYSNLKYLFTISLHACTKEDVDHHKHVTQIMRGKNMRDKQRAQ